jgi:hypothetical protein
LSNPNSRTVSPGTVNRIEAYASARGVTNPACIWRETAPGYGYWELRGEGDDRKGWPLVWRVATELGIKGGAGNADQTQISHPDRAVFPPGRWERELTTMLGDQDYPIQPEETAKAAVAERVYTPSMLKQQKMLEELAGAMEVLPDVIESLSEYSVAQLEPYASRIILATVLLQTIEAKMYAEYDDAEDDDEDDDSDEPTDLFKQDEITESAKDAAVMALAGKTGDNDGSN